jgi:hypothetical protein
MPSQRAQLVVTAMPLTIPGFAAVQKGVACPSVFPVEIILTEQHF